MRATSQVELVLHPRSPRGRIRSVGFSSRGWLVAQILVGSYLLLLVAGLVAAPAAISKQLAERDYAARVARRQQLGERLLALVGRLEALHRQGEMLAERLERLRRVYGLVELAEPQTMPYPYAPSEIPPTIFGATIAHGNRLETELREGLGRADAALAELADYERANPDAVKTTPARTPIGSGDYVTTSSFGSRRSPYTRAMEFHAGLDLAAPVGTPIVAPAEGVVVFAGFIEASRRSGWWRLGRTVVLRHGDRFRTVYGHCGEIKVRSGERVKAGALIASVGDTGWTTAPHLHFEIRRHVGSEWLAVDPRDYLLDRAEAGATLPRAALPAPAPAPEPLPRAFLR